MLPASSTILYVYCSWLGRRALSGQDLEVVKIGLQEEVWVCEVKSEGGIRRSLVSTIAQDVEQRDEE